MTFPTMLTKLKRSRQQQLKFHNPPCPCQSSQVGGGPWEENEENKRMLHKVSHPASNNCKGGKFLFWKYANSNAAEIAMMNSQISVQIL